MRKRIVSALLALVMALSLLPMTALAVTDDVPVNAAAASDAAVAATGEAAVSDAVTATKDETAVSDVAAVNEVAQDGAVPVDAAHFPDANFRAYVAENCDTDGSGTLSPSEIAAVTKMSCSGKSIASLEGVEYFTALTELSCSGNQLTALDVSKNTALTTLSCGSNQLTALDVSGCAVLMSLDSQINQLTSLDVSKNTALTMLICHNNQLTALDVSRNTALTGLYCHNNQLTALDVSRNTALVALWCKNNPLTSLKMDGCNALEYLVCSNTLLETVNIPDAPYGRGVYFKDCSKLKKVTFAGSAPNFGSDTFTGVTATAYYPADNDTWTEDVRQNYGGNLTWVPYGADGPVAEDGVPVDAAHFPDVNFRAYVLQNCDTDGNGTLSPSEIAAVTKIGFSYKKIASLEGVEYFTALTKLFCSSNQLTSLDVSKNAALTTLECGWNQLTALDVSKNTALTSLDCWSNQLTALDVSKNTALTHLSCGGNQLTALDVSDCTALASLYCERNQLTSLDVSDCTALTSLYCDHNQLTALDVSKNTTLTWLRCGSNQLTALDVSKNTALTELRCDNNQLTALDVSRNNALTRLDCYENQLTALDVNKNAALKELYCQNNQLTALNVSQNTALKRLICDSNPLPSLKIDGCTSLRLLSCRNTLLKTVNIPDAPLCREFGFDDGEGVKFSDCSKLTRVFFAGSAPLFRDDSSWGRSFANVTATVYYPADDATWTEDMFQNYGGNLTWVGMTKQAGPKPTAAPKSGVTMRLSWTAVKGATSYELYRATAENGTYTYVKTTTGTSTSDTNLTAGTRYFYKVMAYKTENGQKVCTQLSAPVAAVTLATPTISKAEPTDTGVQVRWSKASGADRYNVYRADTQNGKYTYLASVVGGTQKYVDTTAQGGHTYYYKVRPYKKYDGIVYYGGYSEAQAVTVLADTKLTAVPKSGVTMRLSWTAVKGATSYEIYRATSAKGPYTYVKTTTGTSTSDTNLTAGTRYYYMIRAVKTVNGAKQYSKYTAAVAVALATPMPETAKASGSGVTLTWSKASGADRYNVYRYDGNSYVYVASIVGGVQTYTDAGGKAGDQYKIRAYKRVDGVVYYGGWSDAIRAK